MLERSLGRKESFIKDPKMFFSGSPSSDSTRSTREGELSISGKEKKSMDNSREGKRMCKFKGRLGGQSVVLLAALITSTDKGDKRQKKSTKRRGRSPKKGMLALML